MRKWMALSGLYQRDEIVGRGLGPAACPSRGEAEDKGGGKNGENRLIFQDDVLIISLGKPLEKLEFA